MPEISTIQVGIFAAIAAIGTVFGWILHSRRTRAQQRALRDGWQEQLNTQIAERNRLTEQNRELMDQVSSSKSNSDDAGRRSEQLAQELKEARSQLAESRARLSESGTKLESARSERDQLQSQLSATAASREDVREKDAQIEKLRVELGNWQKRLPPLVERFKSRSEQAEQLESRLAVAQQKIEYLEAQSDHNGVDAAPETGKASGDGQVDPHDNLQEIKGIGPAIEKTLNEMGIVRFQQIADMSEYEIDRIAKRLKGLRSRIYREDWIGQARNFRDQNVDV